jgi:hypothetical protein
MVRFWVIAPLYYDSGYPDTWETVWKYDLDQGVISIGWGELGDVSGLETDDPLAQAHDRPECSSWEGGRKKKLDTAASWA